MHIERGNCIQIQEIRSSGKLASRIALWLVHGAHFGRKWLPDSRNTVLWPVSANKKIRLRTRIRIRMWIRIKPRMKIRIKIKILIMTCGLKA